MKIIIKSEVVNTNSGTSRNGKSYSIREQNAALDNGGDFPHPFRIQLEDKQPAYAPGEYQLDPQSIYVGDFQRLSIGRVKLLPVQVRKPA